ncbi:MAG: hypothetical protein Q7T25_13630 [Sideroxyarcus sp.]|nr:hypothetical protein [Sideroxyarcus sp.]
MKSINKRGLYCFLALMIYAGAGVCEELDGNRSRSMHAGIFYPNGVDIVGYTIEDKLSDNLYRYYTFGFPALASIGISYYKNYAGDGLTASIGTGIGFLNQVNVSVAYQWQIRQNKEPAFVKLGLGYAESLVAHGAFPVLSFEQRLE